MNWRTACDASVPVFRQRFTLFQQSSNRAKPHDVRGRWKRVESGAEELCSFAHISPLREWPGVRNVSRLLDVDVWNVLRLFKTDNSTGLPGKPAPAPIRRQERRDAVRYSSDEEPPGLRMARGDRRPGAVRPQTPGNRASGHVLAAKTPLPARRPKCAFTGKGQATGGGNREEERREGHAAKEDNTLHR
jgi:hypothetical protein